MKTLRNRLLLLVLGLAIAPFWGFQKPLKPRPNILFIFTDDQSYRTVSCYEGAEDFAHTPHIDKLAAEGIRFSDAYVGPWCAPARAMMMTGKMLHAINGLDFNQYPTIRYNSQQFRMWPSVFRNNGYTTAIIGKWHLGAEYGHGTVWDHSIIWNHSEPEKAGEYYTDQKLRFDGGDYQAVGGYSTDNYTQYAQKFISQAHQKPWMLWLCYDGIHAPHMPAERHKGVYDQAGPIHIPDDVYPPRPTKPAYMKNYAMLTPNKDGVPIAQRGGLPLPKLVQKYQSAALSIDEGIGALIETLKETGALENTVIVLTSDQGLAMGHHGMTIKVAPYDDNIRTPLIIKLPNENQGKICRIPVQGLDLIPTFFELAGIKLPWKMNGKSLMPLLQKPDVDWKRPVVLENFSMKFGNETDTGITDSLPNQGVDWWISLREGKYKYIRTLRKNEIEELYDLAQDPHELTNLALLPTYKIKLRDFRDKLTAQLKASDAQLINKWPIPRF